MNIGKTTLTIAGLTCITSNEKAFASNDIGKLWGTFMQDPTLNHLATVNNKRIFSVYSDYESDDKGEYRVTIGYEVSESTPVSKNLHKVTIPTGNYKEFPAKSSAPLDIVNAWKQIWSATDLSRNYISDCEVYEGNNATIFIGIKK